MLPKLTCTLTCKSCSITMKAVDAEVTSSVGSCPTLPMPDISPDRFLALLVWVQVGFRAGWIIYITPQTMSPKKGKETLGLCSLRRLHLISLQKRLCHMSQKKTRLVNFIYMETICSGKCTLCVPRGIGHCLISFIQIV